MAHRILIVTALVAACIVGFAWITLPANNTPATALPTPSVTYDFKTYLYPGISGADVSKLQVALTALGFYSGPISGYYDKPTTLAVEAYQKAHGIQQAGTVGPLTRGALDSRAAASTSTAPSTTAQAYTLAQVAMHKDATSCWAAINGNVYDLTAWINQHPGGPEHILNICGTDGSAAFNAQHGGQSQPAAELATFLIGTLAH